MAKLLIRKETKIAGIICLVISCALLYMIADNWVGLTLAEHNLLPETDAVCVDITRVSYMKPAKRASGYLHYYELTFDNGLTLSIPEAAVDRASTLSQPQDLLGKSFTWVYCPGLIPLPIGRLVAVKSGDNTIISSQVATDEFRLWITVWGLYLIIPGFCVLFIFITEFLKSSFWQRSIYRIKKYYRDYRKSKNKS